MRKSTLAVALALFESGLAGAASTGEFRIKAPRPFLVGGTAMPAGLYNIEQVSPAEVIQVTNTTTNSSVMVIGSPISSAFGDQTGRVTFTSSDGKYALTQVFLRSGVSFGLPVRAEIR